MGATLIFDNPLLDPILLVTHFPISEGRKAEQSQQCEQIWKSGSKNCTRNRTQVTGMVAQRFTLSCYGP